MEKTEKDTDITPLRLKVFLKNFKQIFIDLKSDDIETRQKQYANLWTLQRLAAAFGVPISLFLNGNNDKIFALMSVVYGSITDFFDGKAARKYGVPDPEFGKNFDIVVDKVFATFVGFSLTITDRDYLKLLLGEFLIAITNVGGKTMYPNLDGNSTYMGKIKQWPLFGAFALGLIPSDNEVLCDTKKKAIAIAFYAQLATLISYIVRHAKQIYEIPNGKKRVKTRSFVVR